MKEVAPIRNSNEYETAPGEAERIWRWLLIRQGVGSELKFDTVEQIADRSLGLHAARLSSPYVTAIARSSDEHIPQALFDHENPNELITLRCMRKTLHVMPLALASAAHNATLHFRERDALRHAFNAQISSAKLSTITDSIVHLLEDEPSLSHRTIEQRLHDTHTSISDIRIALKIAWERGILTYRNSSQGWNRECRTFALTKTLHPEFDIAMSREQATATLIFHYFDRYGPASIRDAMWWSGLSREAITAAMSETNTKWVSVTTPWSDSKAYMPASRLEEFYQNKPEPNKPLLNFLAHEDVALKAYFETRKRYLGTLTSRTIFNQIGEVLPSIIFDGQIVGKWKWDNKDHSVQYIIFNDYKSLVDKIELERLQHKYTEALRASLLTN